MVFDPGDIYQPASERPATAVPATKRPATARKATALLYGLWNRPLGSWNHHSWPGVAGVAAGNGKLAAAGWAKPNDGVKILAGGPFAAGATALNWQHGKPGMRPEDWERVRRAAVGRLASLHGSGVLQLPKVRAAAGSVAVESAVVPSAPVAEAASPTIRGRAGAAEAEVVKKSRRSSRAGSLFDAADAAAGGESAPPTLNVLQKQVAACTRCDELARTRTQTVFGVGNPAARLCFLGEAPGADEDRLGEPFVGRAGQLLTRIIESCRMKRGDVYILNMIKCRPPNNRNPLPDELSNCRCYLESQLDLIQPEFICCLGAVASQNLLGTTLSIGKLRGKVHTYRGAKVVCTYHPAFLLRSPAFKKETWEDMKLLMREMGMELG